MFNIRQSLNIYLVHPAIVYIILIYLHVSFLNNWEDSDLYKKNLRQMAKINFYYDFAAVWKHKRNIISKADWCSQCELYLFPRAIYYKQNSKKLIKVKYRKLL